jgi:hypothetical protein
MRVFVRKMGRREVGQPSLILLLKLDLTPSAHAMLEVLYTVELRWQPPYEYTPQEVTRREALCTVELRRQPLCEYTLRTLTRREVGQPSCYSSWA